MEEGEGLVSRLGLFMGRRHTCACTRAWGGGGGGGGGVCPRAHVIKSGARAVETRNKQYFLMGLSPKMKNEWNKWKNHFYEMKGDVVMSLHGKERNKKMPTPIHKVTHNPIPTSLFCFNILFDHCPLIATTS